MAIPDSYRKDYNYLKGKSDNGSLNSDNTIYKKLDNSAKNLPELRHALDNLRVNQVQADEPMASSEDIAMLSQSLVNMMAGLDAGQLSIFEAGDFILLTIKSLKEDGAISDSDWRHLGDWGFAGLAPYIAAGGDERAAWQSLVSGIIALMPDYIRDA